MLHRILVWVLRVLNAPTRSFQRGMPSVWPSSLGIGEITTVGVSPILKHVHRVGWVLGASECFTAFLFGSGGYWTLHHVLVWVLGDNGSFTVFFQRGMPSVWPSSLGIGEITVGVSPSPKTRSSCRLGSGGF